MLDIPLPEGLVLPVPLGQIVLYSLPLVVGASYIWLARKRAEIEEMPLPVPNNLLLGHLKFIGDEIESNPKGTHIDLVFRKILDDRNTDLLAVDMRPIQYKMIFNINGPLAELFCKATSEHPFGLRRSPTTHFYDAIIGDESVFSAWGQNWKDLRRRYNPGFHAKHMYTLTSDILVEATQCVENIISLAQKKDAGGIVKLLDPLTRFSFDVIGIVALEETLGAQRPDQTEGLGNGVYDTFETLKALFAKEGAMGYRLDTWFWKQVYGRKLSSLLRNIIHQKERERELGKSQPRSIIGLTLSDTTSGPKPSITSSVDQMKTFLFAGHDTAASTMCWSIYELYRHPHCLQELQKELHTVFSLSDSMSPEEKQSTIISRIREQPEQTLNALVYLDAIIKETLRFWQPASSVRMNYKHPLTFTHNGTTYNLTENYIIYNILSGIHLSPKVWPEPVTFRPERWIGEEYSTITSKLVAEGWYRAFERGPRNCIGQLLAMIEIKIMLCLLVTRFEFDADGEELRKGKRLEFRIIAKPEDDMMMRVKVRT